MSSILTSLLLLATKTEMKTLSSIKSDPRCPTWETLSDFYSDNLPENIRQEVSSHISSCSDCTEVLSAISEGSDDGMGGRIGVAWLHGNSPEVHGAAYGLMEAAAKKIAIENTVSSDPDENFTVEGEIVNPRPGLRVGPYLLLETVGSGGMGVVYYARHAMVNRAAALKLVRAGAYAGTLALARFRTEGEAIARLHHANIAQLYEFGEHESLPYLAMEWLPGGTLADRLAAGPIDFREAAQIVRALAEGMAFAHERDVIHRDLKPANILLAANGTPKVVDFGLAKLVDLDEPSMTVTDTIFGTPSYMPPEQADGRTDQIGPLSDVYSLGAILYETLTNQPPFVGSTRSETLKLVIRGEVVAPSKLRPNIPRDLEAVCLKCLEWDRSRRYETAQALADDLGRWLDGEPTHVRPLTRLKRAARVVRRRWRSLVAMPLVLVTAAVLGSAMLNGTQEIKSAKDNADEKVLQELQTELAKGKPVTLIGETGAPKWWKWYIGATRSQASVLETDDTFSVQTHDDAVMELLPDPMTDHYRMTAQIRHYRGRHPTQAGLFVAHKTYPWHKNTDASFFLLFSFNAVEAFPQGVLPSAANQPDGTAPIRLYPILMSTEKGQPTRLFNGMSGAGGELRLKPPGAENEQWYDLEVVISPEKVIATFNGQQPLTLTRDKIKNSIDTGLNRLLEHLPNDPIAKALRPEYAPRGGLGLMILARGSAAFRNVVITPIPAGR